MDGAALWLDKVSSTYLHEGRRLPVLEEVSLHVKQGEFVSVLGPSGCGKSTLLKIAAGLIRPDAGKVRVARAAPCSRAAAVGYMAQKDLLLPWKSCLQNAALPLLARGAGREEAFGRVRELLPVFGLEGFAQAYPAQLSGGMRQRAALLRTVLTGSPVLLLDEPFAALDALTRERLQEWLLEIWARFGRSVLFVTHSIDEAVYLSDRIYMISGLPGRVALELAIRLPRPRERSAAITSPEFTAYRQTLIEALRNIWKSDSTNVDST